MARLCIERNFRNTPRSLGASFLLLLLVGLCGSPETSRDDRSAHPNDRLTFDMLFAASGFTAVGSALERLARPAEGPAAALPPGCPSERTPQMFGDLRLVSYRILPGDTLSGIWQRCGGSPKSAELAADALGSSGLSLHSIHIGDAIELALRPDGEIVGLKTRLPGPDRVISLRGGPLRFSASVKEIETLASDKTVSGTISTSLFGAAERAGLPFTVLDEMVDLLGDRIAFERDMQPGDTFTAVYTERHAPTGERLAPGPLKAAGIRKSGKLFAVIRGEGADGKPSYFDETGKAVGAFFLRFPVQFTRISSIFTNARFHPILKVSRPHNGVDFAAPAGTPVRAVGDGRVIFSGASGGSGLVVRIRHDAEYSTAYLHLSKIAGGLAPGSKVRRGDVIGLVGMTGFATGAHLHFSVFRSGRYVNPMTAKLGAYRSSEGMLPAARLHAWLDVLESRPPSDHLTAAASEPAASSSTGIRRVSRPRRPARRSRS